MHKANVCVINICRCSDSLLAARSSCPFDRDDRMRDRRRGEEKPKGGNKWEQMRIGI
jgi:hypothetical protein